MALSVDFCGEIRDVPDGQMLTIGREADLSVDDNQFLHRRFLVIQQTAGVWMLANVGTHLTATVADDAGRLEAFLAPGAALPLVFEHMTVTFTAGPTFYSLAILNKDPSFTAVPVQAVEDGDTTIGATSLTPDQRRLIVALAEPRLRGDGRAAVAMPSNAEAAARLGWTITRFNRKLDNVCQKLQRLGVRGLHGGPDRLASNRRTRLVEYAVATRLVTREHLALLDSQSVADEAGDSGDDS